MAIGGTSRACLGARSEAAGPLGRQRLVLAAQGCSRVSRPWAARNSNTRRARGCARQPPRRAAACADADAARTALGAWAGRIRQVAPDAFARPPTSTMEHRVHAARALCALSRSRWHWRRKFESKSKSKSECERKSKRGQSNGRAITGALFRRAHCVFACAGCARCKSLRDLATGGRGTRTRAHWCASHRVCRRTQSNTNGDWCNRNGRNEMPRISYCDCNCDSLRGQTVAKLVPTRSASGRER